MNKAIGLIEVTGLTNAIVAADECVKAANVNLIGVEKVSGGIVTVKVIGDVSAVMSAVEAGRSMVEHSGMFRSAHVIPRLNEEVLDMVLDKQETEEELQTKEEKSEEQITEELSKEVVNEIVEAVTEEMQTIINETIEEENSNSKSKKEELTKEKLSKKTVKELRQLAISNKIVKTWKEAKQLKKDDLIEKLLK